MATIIAFPFWLMGSATLFFVLAGIRHMFHRHLTFEDFTELARLVLVLLPVAGILLLIADRIGN